MTFEARPEAVFSASAGAAATSEGAGNPLGSSGAFATGGGGGTGLAGSFLQDELASMAMSMAVEMYFMAAISAGYRLPVNTQCYRVTLRHAALPEAGGHTRGNRGQPAARNSTRRSRHLRRGNLVPSRISRRERAPAHPARGGAGLAPGISAGVYQSLRRAQDRLGPGRGHHRVHRFLFPVEPVPAYRSGALAAFHLGEQLHAVHRIGGRLFDGQHHGV